MISITKTDGSYIINMQVIDIKFLMDLYGIQIIRGLVKDDEVFARLLNANKENDKMKNILIGRFSKEDSLPILISTLAKEEILKNTNIILNSIEDLYKLMSKAQDRIMPKFFGLDTSIADDRKNNYDIETYGIAIKIKDVINRYMQLYEKVTKTPSLDEIDELLAANATLNYIGIYDQETRKLSYENN